jgi:hypothetical protein
VSILASPHADPPARRRPAREGQDPAVVRRRLDAEVTRADLKTGVLTLKSVAGPVRVELPAHVVAAFPRGDMVPSELAVIPAPLAPASPPTDQEQVRRTGLAALLFAIFGKNKK